MAEQDHPLVADELMEVDLACRGLRLKIGRNAAEAEAEVAVSYGTFS